MILSAVSSLSSNAEQNRAAGRVRAACESIKEIEKEADSMVVTTKNLFDDVNEQLLVNKNEVTKKLQEDILTCNAFIEEI